MINPNYIISSSPSPFPGGDPISTGDHDDDHHHLHHQFFVPNGYRSSSSTSLSCHMFFNSPQDQSHEYYHHTVLHQPEHHDFQEGENRAGSYDLEKKDGQTLKLTLWKNEKQYEEENPANSKWMSSKMRLIQKMKNSVGSSSSATVNHLHEDQKQLQGSSSLESDHLSSNTSSMYNGNPAVRVCADCNTTKTPLWRSGPKGPKSLCNACGIRQRKARRAMAAAAANGASETATLKIKVQNKEKIIKSRNGVQAPQFKKRCSKITAESSHHHHHHSQKKKKNVFEDFLLSLSENLSFHRVFPQDEKEAAILLMALSCGLVHG